VQQYQTLHPVDSQATFYNQYIRLPQLVLTGDYPDQRGGFDYFMNNEATSFNIRKMPGTTQVFPIGDRLYAQPGVSLPLNWPYLYVIREPIVAQQISIKKCVGLYARRINTHAADSGC